MKRTKIIALTLSACMALAAFAGCDSTKETSESTAATESSSEATTEESTEASQDTEESQDQGGDVEFDQETANTFMSKFAEQSFASYDNSTATPEQMLKFTRIYLKLNESGSIHYADKGDLTFETIDMDTANDVIIRYFGYNFTDDDCSGLPKPPTTFSGDMSGAFFEDDKIWFLAADGEAYNCIAIVDSATSNAGEGTITFNFTVYAIDLDTYSQMDIDGAVKYYRMTPAEAAADSTLHKVGTGTAVVDVAQSGSYVLLAYNV